MPHPPLQPGWIDSPHLGLSLGNFQLESGEAICDFYLSYVLHGELNTNRSNAVLALCALGSTHHRLDFLIGMGRALDMSELCVICVDAIGNGLTTSPSSSEAQPGMKFPRFSIRDMVESQRRLIQDHLDIDRLRAVVGASMGGMQALQWGVSHPGAMERIVAMTPMAKTTPWSGAVNEIGRKALMADPQWAERSNASAGWGAWVPLMQLISGRTPQALASEFAEVGEVLRWIDKRIAWQREVGLSAIDWVYQTWAYDAHDVGTTPGFYGQTQRALQEIKAKTLVLAPKLDLFNPIEAAREATSQIPCASFVLINSDQGHQSAGPARADDAQYLNEVIHNFLNP